MQKSNSKTPLRTGGRSESFSAYTTNSHSPPTTPANSVYSYQWTIVSPAMSSYDSSHANKVWKPKNKTSTGSRTRHNHSDARSLVHHKNKSFSEGWEHTPPHNSQSRSSHSHRNSYGSVSPRTTSPVAGGYYHSFTTINVSMPLSSTPPNVHFNIPAPVVPSGVERPIPIQVEVTRGRGHRRSASDTFDDNEIPTTDKSFSHSSDTTHLLSSSADKAIKSSAKSPQHGNHHSSDGKYHSWSKQHSGTRYEKKVKPQMVDATTQTTFDVGTQTADLPPNVGDILQAATLLILGSKKSRLSVKSMSFNGGKMGESGTQTNEAVENSSLTESELLISGLDDLEKEIAMMRFKALSLQEQVKWLEQEKKQRPNAPVSDMHTTTAAQSTEIHHHRHHHQEPVLPAPTGIKPEALITAQPVPVAAPNAENTPTIEFTSDKPAVDRCYSPVPSRSSALLDQRAFQVKSPDPSTRQDLNHNQKSSAFSKLRGIAKSSRLTKSTGALPELPQENSPRLLRATSIAKLE